MSASYRRRVEFIGEMVGEQGGLTWVLVLSCGHTELRPQRRSRPAWEDFRGLWINPTAPRRVKCRACSHGLDPLDDDVKEAVINQVERCFPIRD